MWADVLAADGFAAFEEARDPFDGAIAERLRRYVYSSGGTIDPAQAYRLYRGRDPAVEPMLRQRGLLSDAPGAEVDKQDADAQKKEANA
jgi:peptidyl-dipeptidase Dcp